jgi:hypothetical protein
MHSKHNMCLFMSRVPNYKPNFCVVYSVSVESIYGDGQVNETNDDSKAVKDIHLRLTL